VVPYEDVCDAPVAGFTPERSWRFTSQERP
jgi:hypothetical protein